MSNFGSFEGWSDLIRGALVWLGVADPVASQRDIAAEAEPDRDLHRELLSAWFEVFGDEPIAVRDLVAEAAAPFTFDDPRALRGIVYVTR